MKGVYVPGVAYTITSSYINNPITYGDYNFTLDGEVTIIPIAYDRVTKEVIFELEKIEVNYYQQRVAEISGGVQVSDYGFTKNESIVLRMNEQTFIQNAKPRLC